MSVKDEYESWVQCFAWTEQEKVDWLLNAVQHVEQRVEALEQQVTHWKEMYESAERCCNTVVPERNTLTAKLEACEQERDAAIARQTSKENWEAVNRLETEIAEWLKKWDDHDHYPHGYVHAQIVLRENAEKENKALQRQIQEREEEANERERFFAGVHNDNERLRVAQRDQIARLIRAMENGHHKTNSFVVGAYCPQCNTKWPCAQVAQALSATREKGVGDNQQEGRTA